MKYILSILAIALGVYMVIKTEWFLQNFGRSAWAEDKLGGGGTRLMYKVLGIIIIFISLSVMTGSMEGMVMAVLGPLFGLQ
ncbi:MAG: hypothetical protein HOL80_03465 [Candidatus Magasanikbacteria bacterium]|jgi:hypothetical protein|nr:hypothetical protein [Candidatus Magasanikbacteria bacterium]MBT5262927.1 hypothetical protein [Candidatus Magasanikbacteria bacterium]MBT5819958.1 hypothetical protein [Candidatus Magasanikbacteria bacterium]MBT6294616.1 hypothetical protein [Candidatus Magasanikbacteria bacterium]|tara:strand:+ start:73 stop:315 length:243 start_codon:yes stop_codon:yes gene_type:complete